MVSVKTVVFVAGVGGSERAFVDGTAEIYNFIKTVGKTGSGPVKTGNNTIKPDFGHRFTALSSAPHSGRNLGPAIKNVRQTSRQFPGGGIFALWWRLNIGHGRGRDPKDE